MPWLVRLASFCSPLLRGNPCLQHVASLTVCALCLWGTALWRCHSGSIDAQQDQTADGKIPAAGSDIGQICLLVLSWL